MNPFGNKGTLVEPGDDVDSVLASFRRGGGRWGLPELDAQWIAIIGGAVLVLVWLVWQFWPGRAEANGPQVEPTIPPLTRQYNAFGDLSATPTVRSVGFVSLDTATPSPTVSPSATTAPTQTPFVLDLTPVASAVGVVTQSQGGETPPVQVTRLVEVTRLIQSPRVEVTRLVLGPKSEVTRLVQATQLVPVMVTQKVEVTKVVEVTRIVFQPVTQIVEVTRLMWITNTPTATGTSEVPSPTATETPTATLTPTLEASPTNDCILPTHTPTATSTVTATATPSPTLSGCVTATPTATVTETPTGTATPTPTQGQ